MPRCGRTITSVTSGVVPSSPPGPSLDFRGRDVRISGTRAVTETCLTQDRTSSEPIVTTPVANSL